MIFLNNDVLKKINDCLSSYWKSMTFYIKKHCLFFRKSMIVWVRIENQWLFEFVEPYLRRRICESILGSTICSWHNQTCSIVCSCSTAEKNRSRTCESILDLWWAYVTTRCAPLSVWIRGAHVRRRNCESTPASMMSSCHNHICFAVCSHSRAAPSKKNLWINT